MFFQNKNKPCAILTKSKIMNMDITTSLLGDVSNLIDRAKNHLSVQFNSTLVLLNWEIGSRIDQDILKHKRADYGKQIIFQLAKELQIKYGRGFDRASLFRMVQFSKFFPDQEIVATLSQQLSWSHFVEIIAISDDLKRSYYLEMCRIERWSVRALRSRIDTMLYERTALAKKPEDFIRQSIKQLREENTLAPEFIFHDPYFLNFVELPSSHSETDLENTILDELTKFLQEFGNDFCFVTRQKRMSTERIDRYLDLLFFHRGLRRLIAIELKIGRFEPAYKGQMEWYLNWLDKNERKPDEEKPLGIILCADKDQEDIEYLELEGSNIHVAQYLTQLPPKEILEEKLRKAISIAREKYASTKKKMIKQI
ncbi:MAG: PDDEXK nuclease domain-containing protein [Wolbachia endosymbiont of Nomada fabriciana]|uniref:PDDEXK nuclease domain-containing protein n=1 Tax=unclassified Wolbachia TaxID=2640676 RepID=UPI00221E4E6F|nr:MULTISPECIES: PDDEXK nuclease domain-containing protein [unclassified Wolbachia]MDX5496445.1 PDDEXK nuclease domain-containing protein [Wolbachia endosymbiont of Nomada fabriciana]